MQFRGVALIASKATYLYIRVSLTIKKFKTSSSTFTEILSSGIHEKKLQSYGEKTVQES